MGDQPDRPRDPEGVGALDDMLAHGTDEEVELREWYAARGMWPPPAQRPGQAPPGGPAQNQTLPYTPTNAGGVPGRTQPPPRQPRGPGYAAPPPPPAPPPPRSGPSAAVLGTAAVVGILVILTAALLLWLSSGGGGTTPNGTTTSGATGTSQGDGSASSSDQSGDTGSQSSGDASGAAGLPDGATACQDGGTSGGLAAAAGNNVTSCGFATSVRDAYIATGTTDGSEVTFKAKSPVTKRKYTVKCSGSDPVTCTGGSNAVVYLY